VVEHEEGVTPDWLQAGGFEVDIAGVPASATLSLRPFYDPDRLRIRS
jgi:4-methylaminobutanoate oxidase (formaldehyde-forming)